MIEFLILCANFSEDEVAVIYVKNLRIFELIGENFIIYDMGFKASGDLRFFQLMIKENIELRNWDAFFEKEETTDGFLSKLEACRAIFNGNLSNRLGLDNHFNYTLARDMWWDIGEKNYLWSKWAYSWRKEMLPKSEEELNLYLDFNKGGYFMINEKFVGDTIKDVHSYDASSNHISLIARKDFPYGGFEKEEDPEKIADIILSGYYSWIGEFYFEGLENKVKLPINLAKFGKRLTETNFYLTLCDVDFEWFKQVFEWKNLDAMKFYYSKKKTLGGINKNILTMIKNLYDNKEGQAKGTFARNIMKFRAELPFGQSIKCPKYKDEAVYMESCNKICSADKTESFKEIQQRLLRRNSFPYQIGLWTVAYSRLELINLILKIGTENVVYSDTDCVKFLGDAGLEAIKEKNNEIDKEFRNVKKKYLFDFGPKIGRWQDEGTCSYFKAIGIKWYIYELNGDLKVKACGADTDKIKECLNQQLNPFQYFSREMKVEGLFKTMTIDDYDNTVKIFYRSFIDDELVEQFGIYEKGTLALLKKKLYKEGK